MKIKKGFKAFKKGLKCQDFQYEENTEYEIKEEPILCEKGFHYCGNPLDTLDYYDLCDSEFAEIEDSGITKSDDTKSVTNKIKIKEKLDLSGFIKASFDFLWKKGNNSKLAASGDFSQLAAYFSQLAASGDYSQFAASGFNSKLAASGDSSKLAASGNSSKLAASGNSSKLAASGDNSQLAASGYSSKLAASGDNSQLAASGENSICVAIGPDSFVKGIKGTWITLVEYDDEGKISCVKSAQIDGIKLKADTYYKLKNKRFVEWK